MPRLVTYIAVRAGSKARQRAPMSAQASAKLTGVKPGSPRRRRSGWPRRPSARSSRLLRAASAETW
jgi:hypothetical protein